MVSSNNFAENSIAKRIDVWQENQNEKMRDFTNAMKAQVKRINKERENVELQNQQMQEYLLKHMSPEKLQHYLGKSLEELQNCEKKMAAQAQR